MQTYPYDVEKVLRTRDWLMRRGFEPWPKDQIDTYMERVLDACPGNWAWKLKRHYQPWQVAVTVLLVLCTLTIIQVVGTAITGRMSFFLASVGVDFAVFLAFAVVTFTPADGGAWKLQAVGTKSTLIPEFARQRIEQLAPAFPSYSYVVARIRHVVSEEIMTDDSVLFMKVPLVSAREGSSFIAVLVWNQDGIILPPR